ncbi:MAG: hypothetical protein H8E09_00925 [Gammaproteobacteria bacterium]|nr:hypothetical protein [Gammaproteobacteria bacterium]
MRYGLLVTDPGESCFGTGKYVTNYVGYTSDNINDAETYITVGRASSHIEHLNARNAIRVRDPLYTMTIAPTYEIMAVEVSLVEGWSQGDE